MTQVTDISGDWSAGVTLTEDETWQARSGTVLISTDAVPSDAGAVILRGKREDSVDLNSGKTVFYKSVEGHGVPHLVRMAL